MQFSNFNQSRYVQSRFNCAFLFLPCWISYTSACQEYHRFGCWWLSSFPTINEAEWVKVLFSVETTDTVDRGVGHAEMLGVFVLREDKCWRSYTLACQAQNEFGVVFSSSAAVDGLSPWLCVRTVWTSCTDDLHLYSSSFSMSCARSCTKVNVVSWMVNVVFWEYLAPCRSMGGTLVEVIVDTIIAIVFRSTTNNVLARRGVGCVC